MKTNEYLVKKITKNNEEMSHINKKTKDEVISMGVASIGTILCYISFKEYDTNWIKMFYFTLGTIVLSGNVVCSYSIINKISKAINLNVETKDMLEQLTMELNEEENIHVNNDRKVK